jgi:Bardet-Biedl syndrome 9 protein
VQVLDNSDVGWEESTEAAMTYLLKTALAKNSKEAAAALPQLTPTKDTSRLKKHLALVLERLDKGMRLVKPDKGPKAQKTEQQTR